MKVYNIQFQIYADDEQEVQDARKAIISFIGELANHNRAVTGRKIAEGINKWKDSAFVRRKVLEFFKP